MDNSEQYHFEVVLKVSSDTMLSHLYDRDDLREEMLSSSLLLSEIEGCKVTDLEFVGADLSLIDIKDVVYFDPYVQLAKNQFTDREWAEVSEGRDISGVSRTLWFLVENMVSYYSMALVNGRYWAFAPSVSAALGGKTSIGINNSWAIPLHEAGRP